MNNIKISVDSRERAKIPLFREYIKSGACKLIDGIEIVFADTGDVYCTRLIGIERKAEDFVPSWIDETLDKQLRELKNNFDYPYLFLEYEGIMDLITRNPNMNPDALIGKMASIISREKVNVCFVGSLYIPMVCKTIEKFFDGKTLVKEISYTPIRRKYTPKEVKLDIISRIPKVGLKKGNKLLEHFNNSIGEISRATEDEISEIPGFGNKLSKQIKEIFK